MQLILGDFSHRSGFGQETRSPARFVLARVISWIVPYFRQKEESTKPHEATRKIPKAEFKFELNLLGEY